MKRTPCLFPRVAFAVFAACTALRAADLTDLPIKGTPASPLILLEFGSAPAAAPDGVMACPGDVISSEGANYVAKGPDDVKVVRKGFGKWGAVFQFALPSGHPAGEFTFWARWMQGGDPGQCVQEFKVFAGPSGDGLEERGAFRMPLDDPWKMQWVHGDKPLALKPADAVVEVRNAGAADGAKVFDAFVLSPGVPPAPTPPPIKSGPVTTSEEGEPRSPLGELPSKGGEGRPQILLELGSSAPTTSTADLIIVRGEVAEHNGDRGIEVKKEEVTSLRSGTGPWTTGFRFRLPPNVPEGDFYFCARWKQGGDPNTSGQTFELWAGPDEKNLELRGTSKLKPDGWNYAWRGGAKVAIKPGDAFVEVRNSGAGQTAKTFQSFLLAGEKPLPPPVDLPARGMPEKPVVALGFGPAPLQRAKPDPSVLAYSGTVEAGEGAESAGIGGITANVKRKGFGLWGATFNYDLSEPIPPGYYSFQARYMSGGEPDQAKQTFTILAGPDAAHLGPRGTFITSNRVPFKQQWMKSTGTFAIFPGDKVLQIANTGKAHDIKAFEGFFFSPEQSLPAWMTAEKGTLRSALLGSAKPVENPEKVLCIVDGDGSGDAALFKGLLENAALLEKIQIKYLLGQEADKMAGVLNLPVRPAAVVLNADRHVLGVLSNPEGSDQVGKFLANPAVGGVVPAYPASAPSQPTPTQNGIPSEWLVATGWSGHCGVGSWGLDVESQQRPNPGEEYAYQFYTLGLRTGAWEPKSTGPDGQVVLVDKLLESFAWGKSTSYAVAYLNSAAAQAVTLHLQHSGIEAEVFLDGQRQMLKPDPAAPLFSRPAAAGTQKVEARNDNEIHDDIVANQGTQPPLSAELKLSKGWHCLVLKMVHAQGKDEKVAFAARFTGDSDKPTTGLASQVSDPTAAQQIALAASRIWPKLTLENIPANLPHPDDDLVLVAQMDTAGDRRTGSKDAPFLPIEATLRVVMTDYDGNVMKTVETPGTFPATVKLNLGKAPVAGYYALHPSLWTRDGKLIRQFAADGFSVVRGSAAQKERVDKKELWNSFYYALNEWDALAPWLERLGLYKNLGSTPGVTGKDVEAKWEDAKSRGILLAGDFAGDSNWMNNSQPDMDKVMALVPKYTRYFKTANEIDGRAVPEWNVSRTPEKWVERAKIQHEATHKARPDAVYFGGSLYCSGNDRSRDGSALSPRAWFKKCLELGLDEHIDVWDVHAYPQRPPTLGAPSVTNSPNESDLGVLSVFQEVGKKNTKPFILGETGALPWHGLAGLRYQSQLVAKLAAWTNSREDWLGVAFCAAHRNRRATYEDYAMAHQPGEAALYTAGALIDGMPYKTFASDDKAVQAGWFGNTFMIWRTDDNTTDWKMKLDGSAAPWVAVDVVGRVTPLEVKNGEAAFPISTSPVYVLSKSDYEKLTRP